LEIDRETTQECPCGKDLNNPKKIRIKQRISIFKEED
jgi:hypothetical protein